jgi:hypothetical protein
MRRSARIAVSLGLAATGVLLLAPLARAHLDGRVVSGHVLEVFGMPTDDGRIEPWPVFTFEVDGGAVRHSYAGTRFGDRLYRPAERLRLAPEAFDAFAEQLRFRRVQVFFDANDPVGTAFILADPGVGPGRRVIIGALLVVIGLLGLVFGARRQED